MNNSERPLVRAGSDITTSVLVGATLVMLLVWLAKLVDVAAEQAAADLAAALHIPRIGELEVVQVIAEYGPSTSWLPNREPQSEYSA
jgi:hypothetical protein